jgi:2-keto-4-pentenoate hydratase/2-oxohepta-3-ene-1,7-dioic acid hydratase in catechol pathway
MSLVDTFECIKRFGQADNKRGYLQMETILHSITVQVQPHCITVNYAELAKRIRSKDENLQKCFKKYKGAICGLDTWTVLLANEDTTNLIPIRHRE